MRPHAGDHACRAPLPYGTDLEKDDGSMLQCGMPSALCGCMYATHLRDEVIRGTMVTAQHCQVSPQEVLATQGPRAREVVHLGQQGRALDQGCKGRGIWIAHTTHAHTTAHNIPAHHIPSHRTSPHITTHHQTSLTSHNIIRHNSTLARTQTHRCTTTHVTQNHAFASRAFWYSFRRLAASSGRGLPQ